MDLDLDHYRRDVCISSNPRVYLSAIDDSPERPKRTFVLLRGFGEQAEKWRCQLKKYLIENRVIAFCKHRLSPYLVP